MPMMQILLAQNLKRSLFIDVDFFPSLHNSGMMQKKDEFFIRTSQSRLGFATKIGIPGIGTAMGFECGSQR
jgi:hypothetical protein